MMQNCIRAAFAAAALGLAGCAATLSPVMNGSDLSKVDFKANYKSGEACVNYLLGFIPLETDASVMKAAKKAGIQQVVLVDYSHRSYFFGSKQCVVAYGY